MTDNCILKINDLNKTFGGLAAVSDVCLNVNEGEIYGLIGPNGAGKTTLLKNLLGLLKPTKGKVSIEGTDTSKLNVAQLAARQGFVLQNPDRQLFADTVEKEIAFGPQNLGLTEAEVQSRVEEAMEAVSVTKFREEYPLSLSKGDRAKVVIASVLAMKPQIIILDEPTTGQDYLGCLQVMQIVKELHKRGHTVIIVTHHMPLVAEYAERTIVLCKGEILLDGSTREVFARPEILEKTFITPPQITQLAQRLEKKMGITSKVLSVEEMGEAILYAIGSDRIKDMAR